MVAGRQDSIALSSILGQQEHGSKPARRLSLSPTCRQYWQDVFALSSASLTVVSNTGSCQHRWQSVSALLAAISHVLAHLQDGRTALHYAASWGSQNAVTALLKASASFRSVDNTGKTPLHLAVKAPVEPVNKLIKEAMMQSGTPAHYFVQSHKV